MYKPEPGDRIIFTASPNNSDVIYDVEEVHDTLGVLVSITMGDGARYDYPLTMDTFNSLQPEKVLTGDGYTRNP